MGSSARGCGSNRKIVVGHWQDPEVVEELAGWARAALAMAESRKLKIARIGGMNMREVAVTGGDRVEAQIQLGWSVNGYGVGDLVKPIAEVSDSEVDQLVRGVRGQLHVGRAACEMAARSARSCATRLAKRSACATSWSRAASARSPPRSRICTA